MNSWATEEISMKSGEISIMWDFQERGKQNKFVDPALGMEKQTRESQQDLPALFLDSMTYLLEKKWASANICLN